MQKKSAENPNGGSETRTDGWTDGDDHTIIRTVFRNGRIKIQLKYKIKQEGHDDPISLTC